MIADFMKIVQEFIGSSTLLRAHGRVGGSATILFLSVPPPEKSAGGFQQAGKKGGGWGEGIFARLPSREAGLGWERLRSLAPSREAKQSIFQFLLPARRSLGAGGEEKGSRAKIEKREKCFALRRRQAGGAAGRVNSVPSVVLRALAGRQSRFALRSVIAHLYKGVGFIDQITPIPRYWGVFRFFDKNHYFYVQ